MKSKYWAAALATLLVVCTVLSIWLMGSDSTARQAEIISGSGTTFTVSLSQDQEFTVPSPDGGSNTITVKDGKIAVTAADCPDGYCVERGFCSGGAQIVCLPHRLVIRFLDEQTVDGVVG